MGLVCLEGLEVNYLFTPRHLKIVATCSVGYDAFDIEGLSERNIILTNVPSPFAFEAVADLALYNAITS